MLIVLLNSKFAAVLCSFPVYNISFMYAESEVPLQKKASLQSLVLRTALDLGRLGLVLEPLIQGIVYGDFFCISVALIQLF